MIYERAIMITNAIIRCLQKRRISTFTMSERGREFMQKNAQQTNMRRRRGISMEIQNTVCAIDPLLNLRERDHDLQTQSSDVCRS
jgi:ABC-type dipeptide/oligopeptide/nickel transport system ATPase component